MHIIIYHTLSVSRVSFPDVKVTIGCFDWSRLAVFLKTVYFKLVSPFPREVLYMLHPPKQQQLTRDITTQSRNIRVKSRDPGLARDSPATQSQ